MSDKYSKLFAEYSAGLQYEDVPAESAHEAKRRILDSIGVSMAAFSEDAPKAARMFAYDFEQENGATVWGAPSRVTPEAATFANGLMTRYLDFNDTYLSLEPLHPSDMIPGFMALCEWAGKPPRDILTAIAAGYEVSVNLCDAASVRAYQWDHVVYTGIGAACGAGSIMGQSADTIEHTISIASVPHASMRQTRAGELSMWKGAAAANSVRNAVFASLVAQRGLTGPYQPFDGEMGFFAQLLGGKPFDDAALLSLADGAAPTRIQDTYIKKWPVEYHAQSAVDAAVELRDEIGGDINLIDSIHLDTFKVSYEIIAKDPEKWAPKTRETADHSLMYIVAAALLDGTVTKHSFSQQMLDSADIKSLLNRTTLEEDDALTAGYPEGIPNRIAIKTKDGGTLTREVSFPRGHAMNKMSDDEVERKFLLNVEDVWTEEQARQVIDLVWHIDEQRDLSALMEAMRI